MAKFEYTTLAGANFTEILATLNANFEAAQNAFDECLFRTNESPNHMLDALDMNSQSIINLPAPTTATEPLRLGDFDGEATFTLELPHLTDSTSPEDVALLGGTNYPTFAHFLFDSANTGGSAGIQTQGLLVQHKGVAGQVGGITALTAHNSWDAAPDSMTGGVAAFRALHYHGAGVDLSAFTTAFLEGHVSSCYSFGPFSGLMAGGISVVMCGGTSTPTHKYGHMIIDEGATDTTSGSTEDAALCFSSAGGIGPKAVILFSNIFGSQLAKADGSTNLLDFSGNETYNLGFDMTGQTFTNGALFLPNGTGGRIRALDNAIQPRDLLYLSAGNLVVLGDSAMGTFITGTSITMPSPFGYIDGIGIGGTVTQATSKSTGVTLNTVSGNITMNAAALAADTTVTFTLTNSHIGDGDVLILNHVSGGTMAAYNIQATCAVGAASIHVRNVTPGSLSEAVVIRFALIRAAIN